MSSNIKTSNKKTENKNLLVEEYINSLSNIEKEALEIAKIQLESSFNIEKSIGFIKFLNNKKENQ